MNRENNNIVVIKLRTTVKIQSHVQVPNEDGGQ